MTSPTSPTSPDPSFLLIREWQMWMRAKSWSERTVGNRVELVRRVARRADVAPADLSLHHVLEFLSTGSFGASTRQTYHVDLDAWFRWQVEAGHLAENPMSILDIPKANRRPPVPLKGDHIVAVLRTRMHARTRTMILLMGYAGLRVSEVAKFRGDDIDHVGQSLRVLGKGNVYATLPLHPLLASIADGQPKGYWFPQWKPNRAGETGGPILGRSVSTIVGNVMRRAGVPGSAHSLRHWYATEMLRQGVDVRVIQQLMRHASLGTTERYVHVDDSQRRAGLLQLPDLTEAGLARAAAVTSLPDLTYTGSMVVEVGALRADCGSCPWRGPLRDNRFEASGDASRHEDECGDSGSRLAA